MKEKALSKTEKKKKLNRERIEVIAANERKITSHMDEMIDCSSR